MLGTQLSAKSIASAIGWQSIAIAILSIASVKNISAQTSTWSIIQPISDSNWVVSSLSAKGNVCTVCCSNRGNYFWRSDDAGRTWKLQQLGIPASTLNNRVIFDICQIDSAHAIGVGSRGLIVSTTDAGNTWSIENCPISSRLVKISCSNFNDGIAVGDSDILMRQNGQWISVPFHPNVDTISLRHKGQRQLFCHDYGHGKMRVICQLQRPDTVIIDSVTLRPVALLGWIPMKLYKTADYWNNLDSIDVPFAARANKWDGYDFGSEVVFSDNDTILVNGYEALIGASTGVISRSLDGGTHWDRFIDSNRFFGFSAIASLPKNKLISEVFDTAVTNHSFNQNPLTLNGKPVVLLSSDAGASWSFDSFAFEPKFDTAISFEYLIGINADGSCIGAFDYIAGQKYGSFLARLDMTSEAVSLRVSQGPTQLFPNPAITSVIVDSMGSHITLSDALGRECEVRRSGDQLDVFALPPGVYYISDGQHRARFVKE